MTQTSGAGLGADKPFFRYDLRTEVVQDGGHRFVDVTDPEGGSSFRFFEVEYAVACGMDGERDLQALVAWAKSELDLDTTTTELGAVVSKLSELKYLSDSFEAAPLGPPPDDVVAALPEIAATPEPQAQPRGLEVELGGSGKSDIEAERPEQPASGDEFELGLAGARDTQRMTGPVTHDVALGAAGNEDVDEISEPSNEVSTDLSQTFRIDKDLVKAAVRASKEMSAVEVPSDFEDELTMAGGEEEAAAEAALAAASNQAIPQNVAPISDISDSIANEAEETESGGAAIVLPDDAPVKVAAEDDEKAAKRKKKAKKKLGPKRNSASYVLWFILVIALGIAAAYIYMTYIKEQPHEKGPSVTPQQFSAKQKAKALANPKPPTGTLRVTEAPTAEVTANRAGLVRWVVEASSEVAEGDEILKLSGYERADKAIERHQKSLTSYEAQLAAAEGKSASRVASIESNVARKKLDIQLANEKRDAFIVKAPIAGVVELQVGAGGRVRAGAAFATITGTGSATVDFTLPANASVAADDELSVVSPDDAELSATCKVTAAEGPKVTLACPVDSGLENGQTLQLTLPEENPSEAPAPEAPAPEAAPAAPAPDAPAPAAPAPDAPAPEAE